MFVVCMCVLIRNVINGLICYVCVCEFLNRWIKLMDIIFFFLFLCVFRVNGVCVLNIKFVN